MKTNTVIAGRNGEPIVPSTTKTLRIKAGEIEPGDWLLKPHGRVMRKDKLILSVEHVAFGRCVFLETQAKGRCEVFKDQMVDVERTR